MEIGNRLDRQGLAAQVRTRRSCDAKDPARHVPPDRRRRVTRFLPCDSKDEKLRWRAVMLKAEGRRANDIADICKRREDWVRRTVRRYNELGPEGVAG